METIIANENVAIAKTITDLLLVFHYPPCKTRQRKKNVFPRIISDWNRLSQPLVMSRAVETFMAAFTFIKY